MKPIYCKITDAHGQTFNNTQWGRGVGHETNGKGILCGPGWIHYYDHPWFAAFFSDIHTDSKQRLLWSIKILGEARNEVIYKYGTTELETVDQIDLPEITMDQKAIFASYVVNNCNGIYNGAGLRTYADAFRKGNDMNYCLIYSVIYTCRYAYENKLYLSLFELLERAQGLIK